MSDTALTAGRADVVPRRRRMTRRPTVGTVVCVVVLALGAIGMLAPFAYMVVTALKSAQHAYDLRRTGIKGGVAELLGRHPRASAAVAQPLERAFIAGLTTIGMLITAPMAGCPFAHLRFPGRNGVFVLLLAALMGADPGDRHPLFLIMRNLHFDQHPVEPHPASGHGAFGVFPHAPVLPVGAEELFEGPRSTVPTSGPSTGRLRCHW